MELRKNILQEIASLLDDEEAMSRVYAFLLSLKGEGLAEHIPGLPYTKAERRQSLSRAEAEVMSGQVSLHDEVSGRIKQKIDSWK
ncbi:MAG TPA: hypothetical protein H9814_05075 [Candidatus Bacteroides merdigallinarum]|uniref:Uncharacterized protein n=1 Tax=Candidatus Bacteroides merdigallinarum TaxID=2838473 RepID=A0A9D2E8R5_9BACE|nr:hypothetical protein [Candidatus Bacteroides merdigallinarum]